MPLLKEVFQILKQGFRLMLYDFVLSKILFLISLKLIHYYLAATNELSTFLA